MTAAAPQNIYDDPDFFAGYRALRTNDTVKDDDGKALHWPVDRYGEEGPRATTWFVDGVVKYHRTTATYVGTLVGAGFLLAHLGEPGPAPGMLAARPALEKEMRRPPFLVLMAVRPGSASC